MDEIKNKIKNVINKPILTVSVLKGSKIEKIFLNANLHFTETSKSTRDGIFRVFHTTRITCESLF